MDPNVMNAQMAPASFYYYTPDPNPENRQHGHFSQHPGFQQVQHHMYPMVPTLPSTPIYSRPNSSCSQQTIPAKVYAPVPSNVTPMASPQSTYRAGLLVPGHPAKLMLETDICDNDSFYYPATPPLSTSGSSMGSPAHMQDILATPLNPMFSGLDGYELVKADEEATSKPLENLDWNSCGSPPLTPVYFQQLQAAPRPGKAISLNTNLSSEHLSANNTNTANNNTTSALSPVSCSPSPSPISDSQEVDFCDPRHLTVGVVATAPLSLDYAAPAPLPAAFKGDNSTKDTALPVSFDFNPALHHGLPTFDAISDLESEDDFLNRLVNLSEQPPTEGKRSRSATCSTTLSLGHDSFLTEGEFDYEDTTSCAITGFAVQTSSPDSDAHKDKKIRKSKESNVAASIMNVAADSTSQQGQQRETSSNSEANSNGNNTTSGATSDAPPAPLPAPPNRRGRKQSLTEDPSKTFVCELCSRRFRRQEHLKRHYRSLHTQDKPFKCSECNKSFSRSDNLAQHARTHGSGAIVMNILDGSEESLDMMGATEGDYHNFGKVLFQVAAEVPGSASDFSSDASQSEDGNKKKRKRTE
ncbi:hypothetical protein F5Y16DRAFT_394601 [Xylariaceae sp. FL0255]|nr:hypothetical protein F5Y16DRAFT_394601 [Xylariaceae sp. FL0255]